MRDPAHPQQAIPAERPADLLQVGHVLDAWGTRGWIKIAPASSEACGLLETRNWWLMPPHAAGEAQAFRVRLARRHAQAVVARLEGRSTRDEAEALRGWTVHARRAEFPEPEADTYYWADLIGCEVVNRAGLCLGLVIGLLDSAAQSTLRVRAAQAAPEQAERLIPFVAHFVDSVDLCARRITVDWVAEFD